MCDIAFNPKMTHHCAAELIGYHTLSLKFVTDITFWIFLIFEKYEAALATQPDNVLVI
jgi:hypothetical protein